MFLGCGWCQCKIGAVLAVGIAWVNMRAVVALLLRKTLSDYVMAIVIERKVGNPVVRKCHGLKVNVVEGGNSPLNIGSTKFE